MSKGVTYYYRNRDRILNSINILYKTDSGFRDRHKAAVKKYKQRIAREKKLLKEKAKHDRKVWKRLDVDGVVTPCCRVGYLSKSIGRSTHTLRTWEKQKFLPVTIVYNSQRYYPKYHFLLIIRSWERRSTLSGFFNEIWLNWDKEKEEWIRKNQ